jgi:hypothetical protein
MFIAQSPRLNKLLAWQRKCPPAVLVPAVPRWQSAFCTQERHPNGSALSLDRSYRRVISGRINTSRINGKISQKGRGGAACRASSGGRRAGWVLTQRGKGGKGRRVRKGKIKKKRAVVITDGTAFCSVEGALVSRVGLGVNKV